MNKNYIIVFLLAIVVILLVYYRKKLAVLFSKAKAQTMPAPAPAQPANTQTSPLTSLDRNKELKLGVTGPEVKYLQHLLGITEDGIFGPITEAALMDAKCFNTTTLDTFPDQTCVEYDATALDSGHGDWVPGTDIINSILTV